MTGFDDQGSSRAGALGRLPEPPGEHPIILAADDDEPARRILSAALVRRFGTDYDVRVVALPCARRRLRGTNPGRRNLSSGCLSGASSPSRRQSVEPIAEQLSLCV